jgi:hypothetical protein
MSVVPLKPEKGPRSYRGGRKRGALGSHHAADPDAVMLRTKQAARRYNLSETKIKTLIRTNRVDSVLVDGVRLISVASLNRLCGITETNT